MLPFHNLVRYASSSCGGSKSKALKGKIGLVTGAALGIGYAISEELLRRGIKGLCVTDVNMKAMEKSAKKLAKEFGRDRLLVCQLDVAKFDDMECIFHKTVKKFCRLDLVVNNAGILDDVHWDKTISINIAGLVKGSKLAYKYMSKENGGCGGDLLNLASILAFSIWPRVPTYVGSKHFVRGFSRCLALPENYKKSGIRVMCMCPGVTITPLITEAGKIKDSPDDYAKGIEQDIKDCPPQPVECVSEGVIQMLEKGKNGSFWVSEGEEPIYEVVVPKHHKLRKKC